MATTRRPPGPAWPRQSTEAVTRAGRPVGVHDPGNRAPAPADRAPAPADRAHDRADRAHDRADRAHDWADRAPAPADRAHDWADRAHDRADRAPDPADRPPAPADPLQASADRPSAPPDRPYTSVDLPLRALVRRCGRAIDAIGAETQHPGDVVGALAPPGDDDSTLSICSPPHGARTAMQRAAGPSRASPLLVAARRLAQRA